MDEQKDYTEFIIRKIKDRTINNILITEFGDDREPELDLTHFMDIITDDLKNYKIILKDS